MNKIDFPVVGIGASAGGLKVLQDFFDHLDPDSEMAFVVITHLAPEKTSALDELIASHTSMQVEQVKKKTEIQPNHIYIIPPNKQLFLEGSEILLADKGQQSVIDVFFRSLGKECEKMAVGIILSGTGSDGALGLKAIKEYGGLTLVQDPKEAAYDGMPRSAIDTDVVDFIMPVKELARKVMDHKEVLGNVRVPLREEELSKDDNAAIQKIFGLLVSKKGHDFKHYKRSSVLRRLQRRLFVTGNRSISQYLIYVQENPLEITELFKDLLISVTNFFRDPEAFEALEREVIPQLFENKKREDSIRIWITGCATGEEVYSLAILLHEYAAANLNYMPKIKIFGTDISDEALQVARRAIYPQTIATDVTKERLMRYFQKEDSGYRVCREIREKVLISNHDVLSDPPFLNQDLITCRNLLIYFNQDLQSEVLKILHYALRPEGCLFLGMADSTIGAKDLFAPIDKSKGIYKARKVPTSQKDIPKFPLLPNIHRPKSIGINKNIDRNDFTFDKIHYSLLAAQYAPTSVIIDENNQVMHSSKGVHEYLSYAEGEPTRDLLKMVSSEMLRSLRNIIFRFNQLEKPRPVSKRIKLQEDNEAKIIKVSVRPIEVSGFPEGFRQVVFEEIEEPGVLISEETGDKNREPEDSDIIGHLESELEQNKEQLQQTIEEYETSTEELMASNEELQSMNEELQTTTEELETSKEELQSVNEELRTVNQELENKIDELKQANNDLKNLMEATEIGIVFLDNKLNIRLFTSNMADIFHLIDSDVGRPLSDVTHKLHYDDLISDINQMLETGTPIQQQVSANGNWYILEMKPYQTVEYNQAGVVITLVNVTDLKKAERELKKAYKELEGKVEAERQLQKELLEVEKKERWRIGQYLHDGTAQNLCGIKMLLDLIDPKLQQLDRETKEELRKIKHLVVKSEENIRELSHFVLPIESEEKISKSFKKLVKQAYELYNVECTFDSEKVADKIKDETTASSLYYIAQEAIRNAISHGQADKIDVNLSMGDDYLCLTIHDNGTGYDKESEGQGRGINIMKHRADLLGGTLSIKGDKKGTDLTCSIPLERVLKQSN